MKKKKLTVLQSLIFQTVHAQVCTFAYVLDEWKMIATTSILYRYRRIIGRVWYDYAAGLQQRPDATRARKISLVTTFATREWNPGARAPKQAFRPLDYSVDQKHDVTTKF